MRRGGNAEPVGRFCRSAVPYVAVSSTLLCDFRNRRFRRIPGCRPSHPKVTPKRQPTRLEPREVPARPAPDGAIEMQSATSIGRIYTPQLSPAGHRMSTSATGAASVRARAGTLQASTARAGAYTNCEVHAAQASAREGAPDRWLVTISPGPFHCAIGHARKAHLRTANNGLRYRALGLGDQLPGTPTRPGGAALKNKQMGDDEMYKVKQAGGLSLLLAIALLSPIATYAQTTVTTRESNFELIAVDGNYLVVRDQNGTRELTVPPDFRFTVDGKSLAVGDLQCRHERQGDHHHHDDPAAGLRHDHQAGYRDLPDRTLDPDQGR